jgi:hypothetical protein
MLPQERYPNSVPLREDFIQQPGLFDYTLSVSGDSNPLAAMPSASSATSETIAQRWVSRLDGDTSLHEVFYLLGVEDESEREEKVAELVDLATDGAIEVYQGRTLDDLRESRAPDLYEQLFRPLMRPKETPEGYPFPHSHYGDATLRTQLLRDIKHELFLTPDVVVNMGSGYDITPSDAFPSARVIHVDSAPAIVEFLRRSGFEAYHPDQVPEELTADLIIDILGPGQGDVPLGPRGVLLTTNTLHIPEGMTVKGVVPRTAFELEPPVAEPEAVRHVLSSGQDLHLIALTKA